jgi:glucokinase
MGRAARSAVGLDVGGSAVKAGRADADGRVLERRLVPAEEGLSPPARLDALAGIARELAGPDAWGHTALGLAVPGLLDPEAGRVERSPNLPWLDGLPLRDGLAERLGVEPAAVQLVNDASAAAAGERWQGAARDATDALVLTLGTGIGGGLLLGGAVELGPSGQAGEVGHLCVDPAGPPCGCGRRGCLETLASASAARERALERGLPADAPGDLVLLAERARAEDGPERELLLEVGRDLGRGLAPALLLLDLTTFVFAGGFAASLDVLEPGIREGLAERAYGDRLAGVRLLAAELGREAGWVGAAALALGAVPVRPNHLHS